MVCFALLYPDVLGYFHTIPYHSPTNKENNIFRMYCCSKNPHFPQVSMFKAVPNLIYWSICSRGPWKNHHIIHSPVMVDLSVEKQGRNPSRASRVFQRETSLKPAFRTCFENAPSKRGFRRNFFFYSFHRAYMDFKALHRCETHCIFSLDRHCQLRMYSINLGLICLLHFPVLCKLSGIHFLILFQVASAFCVPAILLALQGFRFKRRMTC